MKSDAVNLLQQRMQLIESYWRAQGSRPTLVRTIICESIFAQNAYFDAGQILKEARRHDTAISLTSVYRVMSALKAAQLIEAVLIEDKKVIIAWFPLKKYQAIT